jgi:hypothetical protein
MPTESTDYSLWIVIEKLKQVNKSSSLRTSQGTWARRSIEKAHAFAEHPVDDFEPKRKKYIPNL